MKDLSKKYSRLTIKGKDVFRFLFSSLNLHSLYLVTFYLISVCGRNLI